MKWHKRDDVAIRWHWHLHVAGHDPLVHLYPHLEELVLDEGLHVSMKDVRVMP
jgi:hypothetical protein